VWAVNPRASPCVCEMSFRRVIRMPRATVHHAISAFGLMRSLWHRVLFTSISPRIFRETWVCMLALVLRLQVHLPIAAATSVSLLRVRPGEESPPREAPRTRQASEGSFGWLICSCASTTVFFNNRGNIRPFPWSGSRVAKVFDMWLAGSALTGLAVYSFTFFRFWLLVWELHAEQHLCSVPNDGALARGGSFRFPPKGRSILH